LPQRSKPFSHRLPCRSRRTALFPRRSGPARIFSLLLAAGLAFSSTSASLHDPSCAHHLATGATDGVSGAPRADHGAALHGGNPSEHGQHENGTSSDDCTCTGGLCALGMAVAQLPASLDLRVGDTTSDAAYDDLAATKVTQTSTRLQPPGTGPPVAL
jgi:hypothetical protein